MTRLIDRESLMARYPIDAGLKLLDNTARMLHPALHFDDSPPDANARWRGAEQNEVRVLVGGWKAVAFVAVDTEAGNPRKLKRTIGPSASHGHTGGLTWSVELGDLEAGVW